mmetsp:Transcript_37148/g.102201  ORF Transcript_37148/g.102201 Transcript_37148/m.102201 type:complete len:145 (-) Transcript_37148:199-633(-)
MSGYSEVMCSGAHAAHVINCVGIDFISRRGCTGTAPTPTPLSKSASHRAIRQLGIFPVNDVNLLVNRAPSASIVQKPWDRTAGGLPQARRWREYPDAIRQTSIDHQVHRKHSCPLPKDETPRNTVVTMSSLSASANLIGRSRKA